MNLISCTDKCKYQIDGYCSLKDSSKVSNFSHSGSNCMYFSPKNTENYKKNITE